MNGCLYIAIKAPDGEETINLLSGKYHFHLLHKNIGAYIRDPAEVPSFQSEQIFLVHDNGEWHITSDDEKCNFLLAGDTIGYLSIKAKGKFRRIF